jgi:putative PIN family toxin of toxin-antitoxin system
MSRVVLDTNIIVSALLVPSGTQTSVLLLALRAPNTLYVSQPVLAEYDEVLRRPRLKLQPRQIDEALATIRKVANFVAPAQTLSVSAMNPTTAFSNAPKPPKRIIS